MKDSLMRAIELIDDGDDVSLRFLAYLLVYCYIHECHVAMN